MIVTRIRYARDENSKPQYEEVTYIPAGLGGVDELDKRLVELQGIEGKWFYYGKIATTEFCELPDPMVLPDGSNYYPDNCAYWNPEKAPLKRGLTLIDKSEYDSLVALNKLRVDESNKQLDDAQATIINTEQLLKETLVTKLAQTLDMDSRELKTALGI